MQRSAGVGASSRAVINKKFIINTVQGLKWHNRREEEEDCWRQHRLAQDGRSRRPPNAASQRRSGKSIETATAAAAHTSDVETRSFWAEQKQRAMGAGAAASSPVQTATGEPTRTTTPAVRCPNKDGSINPGKRDGSSSSCSSSKQNNYGAKEKGKKRERERRDRMPLEGTSRRSVSDVEEPRRREHGNEGDRTKRKRKKSKKRSKKRKRETRDE